MKLDKNLEAGKHDDFLEFIDASEKGGMFKNGQNQLEQLNGHRNGSLCSLKIVTVQ